MAMVSVKNYTITQRNDTEGRVAWVLIDWHKAGNGQTYITKAISFNTLRHKFCHTD